MSEVEIEKKLAELDRLLNDPDTRMDPDRVWSLLAEISSAKGGAVTAPCAVAPRTSALQTTDTSRAP